MKFLAVVSAAIVITSLMSHPANAEDRARPAPAYKVLPLGIGEGETGTDGALPPSKFCPADKKHGSCVTKFMDACSSAGGYWNAVGNATVGDNMTCSTDKP